MKKLICALLALGGGCLCFSMHLGINGAVIGEGNQFLNKGVFLLGTIFLSCSFVLYIHSKSLETILIPTGSLEAEEDRVNRAIVEYSKHSEGGKTPYFTISGDMQRGAHGKIRKDSHQFGIYKKLRGGVKPSDMIIEGKSRDTLENFLYSIKKWRKKGINKVDISTNRTQYWRFKMFENRAKKEGLIGEDFEVAPLYTTENPLQFAYGVLALVKDYVRTKSYDSLSEAAKHKSGGVGNFLKRVLSKE